MLARDLGDCRDNLRNSQSVFLIVYASNEPKSVLARDLGDCHDNLRNSRSVFLIVMGLPDEGIMNSLKIRKITGLRK